MPEIMLGLSSIDVPTEHLEGSRGHRRSFTRTDRCTSMSKPTTQSASPAVDDMPLGLHDPRPWARRTEAVLDPSAVGVVHEAAGQRDAVSHAVARDNPVTSVVIPAIIAGVEEVEVVVTHHERATLRIGDVFLKIDADQMRTDVEVEAMAMAPIPTPDVLWRKPPVLALAALPGMALGRLGEPSTASPSAWAAAGAAARMLHDAPLPPCPGWSLDDLASHLDGECEWLVTNGVLPADVVTCNRRVAEAALRPWTPVFTHGDLQGHPRVRRR
jgi:hypothetical protein